MKLGIRSYCSFTNKGIHLNGDALEINSSHLDFNSFALHVYKKHEISYSKYHKMDSLCKLALLTSEFLLENGRILENVNPEKIAVILGNTSSSIVSDTIHHRSMDELPSPAVFVYTLPNIMIGEMCIKYKITGENSCFEMDDFDHEFLQQYVEYLLKNEDYDYCITGYIDFSLEAYQAHLFLITKENNNTISTFDTNFKKLTK